MSVEVLDPGVLATVQDLGRPGHAHRGVALSGALDTLSLRVANRLLGNPDGAPAVEATWRGGAWRFRGAAVFAWGGPDLDARLGDAAVAPWTPTAAPEGATLRLGTTSRGARAYLAVRGGFAVPRVLGSASTHRASGLGGVEGRALRAGDVLPVGRAPAAVSRAPLGAAARAALEEALARPRVRAVEGPHAACFAEAAVRVLFEATFRVGDRSDRMGMRIEGAAVRARPDAPATTLWTEGVPCGAVQVPGDGAPIVLLADGPPTGGYPVVACVATADLPRLGQLRPREDVGFERVTVEEARAALREREAWLDREVPSP